MQTDTPESLRARARNIRECADRAERSSDFEKEHQRAYDLDRRADELEQFLSNMPD